MPNEKVSSGFPLYTVGSTEIIWLKVDPVKVRCEACGKEWEMIGADSIESEEVEHALQRRCNGRVKARG